MVSGRRNCLTSDCPLHQAPAHGHAYINEKKKNEKQVGVQTTKHCFLFISEKLFFLFLGLILFSCVRCVSLTKKCHQFAFSSQFAFSFKLFKSTYVRICPLARPFYPVVITSISYFIVWEKMTCRYIWATSCLFTHPKKLDCNIIFEKRKRKRKKQQVHSSSSNNKAIWKIGTREQLTKSSHINWFDPIIYRNSSGLLQPNSVLTRASASSVAALGSYLSQRDHFLLACIYVKYQPHRIESSNK